LLGLTWRVESGAGDVEVVLLKPGEAGDVTGNWMFSTSTSRHGEERNSMVDRREVERLAVDADNGQGCEADDGDVLRPDK
jgi:hypothetical protein